MLIILDEAKRLYDMGFAVHWIKPHSKAPVKKGWNGPTRDDWDTVKKSYKLGYGLGVRMGESSKLKDGTYLANIDIDIKSKGEDDKKEALAALKKHFAGIDFSSTPRVTTGYGMRLFIRTEHPVQSKRVASATTTALVYMPNTQVNQKQRGYQNRGLITEREFQKGFRIRSAWEIDFMSAGKQVVLPPSIHPETGTEYIWAVPLVDISKMPLVAGSGVAEGVDPFNDDLDMVADVKPGKFTFCEVDLSRLPPLYRDALINGDKVDDRSQWCFSVAIVMLRQGYSADEIVSALTDRTHYLSGAAYDRRGSSDRGKAADWVFNYCIKKAMNEMAAENAFSGEIPSPEMLTETEIETQLKELVPSSYDWKTKVTKTGNGIMKPTLNNVVLILENIVSPHLFKKDTFSTREFVAAKTPWDTTAELGRAVTDTEAINMKHWLGAKYGMDVSVNTIFEAISIIADDNRFNPVQDWLLSLDPWDGVPRLYSWLQNHFEAEGDYDYIGEVFSKWLYASVTRIFEPGAKFDWLPILEGAQGTGKSSLGSILFGHKYFLDGLPNLGDKDSALNLMGKLCIEFAELDNLRRGEMETTKAFITRQMDYIRPPYGRKAVECYRSCVFIGTTNSGAFLQDTSGNRRFNPIKVGRLNFEQLMKDKDQLWAEALWAYQNGMTGGLYLSPRVEEIGNEFKLTKMVENPAEIFAGVFDDWVKVQKQNGPFNIEDFSEPMYKLFAAGGPFAGHKDDRANMINAANGLREWAKENNCYADKKVTYGRKTWYFRKMIKR